MTQTEAWRVNYSVYGNGGLLSTGDGLVFQCLADGHFHAYRTDTGEPLWNFEVGDANMGGCFMVLSVWCGLVWSGVMCGVVCHGPMAMSSGPIPGLRYKPMLLTEAGFQGIVRMVTQQS